MTRYCSRIGLSSSPIETSSGSKPVPNVCDMDDSRVARSFRLTVRMLYCILSLSLRCSLYLITS